MDEPQQSVGLSILWTILGYRGQDNLSMRAQYGKLDVKRC